MKAEARRTKDFMKPKLEANVKETANRRCLRRIVRHRPVTWQKITGIKIYDADGWRDGKSFNTPITEKEWLRRMAASTCVHPCGMFHGVAKDA